jgi:hypothetical protein
MYDPELFKPRRGIIDEYIEQYEKYQGADFCFVTKEIAVDFRGGEPITGHLVLQTAIWAYATARSPQALEELMEKVNKADKPPTLKELRMLARKLSQSMAQTAHRDHLAADSYIKSKKGALVLAMCLHLTSCSRPHDCGWNVVLENTK